MEVTGNYNQCFVFSNSFFVVFILVSFCLQTSRSQETYEGKPHQARFADKCRHKD